MALDPQPLSLVISFIHLFFFSIFYLRQGHTKSSSPALNSLYPRQCDQPSLGPCSRLAEIMGLYHRTQPEI